MKRSFFILFLSLTMFSFSNAQSDTGDLIEDLLTTWDKHVAMNALLLNGIDSAYLVDKSASGGRNVGEQFAHIHNVRMMWLSQLAADKAKAIDAEVDAQESLKKEHLLKELVASDKLVRTVLKKSLENGKKLGDMSPTRFLGYLISHESHTRGQIILAMKQSDHALPPQVTYGIWEW
ncbi:MAG: hypothetical protein HEP71_25570 [Roseivirga sp.]|nr:hypothetical protein [Roseivirga sp.]